jgi:SigmaK-factor processing regulatory protein BofA.
MWMILLIISLLALFLYFLGVHTTPDSKAFRLMERFFSGAAILYGFNLIAGFFSMSIAITPVTCLVTGVVGLPGLATLIIIHFMG